MRILLSFCSSFGYRLVSFAKGRRDIGSRLLILILFLAMLPSCTTKVFKYDIPDIPLPKMFSASPVSRETGQTRISAPEEAALAFWWRLFGNQDLNRLVDRALANNPDLRVASQRVMQALARSSQAKGFQWPEFLIPLRIEREAPDRGNTRTTYQIGLRANWRIDLWGEFSALADAADYELWRALFEYDEQTRQLTNSVVAAFVEYLVLSDRMDVARETDNVLTNMLDGMLARLESGDATLIDVEKQRADVQAVKADMPAIALQKVKAGNRLFALVGGLPDSVTLPKYGLNGLIKPNVKLSAPPALLLQRPDVRAVEAQLLAADADIEVARARVLPPLDITGDFGYGSEFIDQVFKPHTIFFNFIANLSATVFDGGRRKREVDYSRAVYAELLETYVKVIYAASLEVEDALSGIQQTAKRVQFQQQAANAAQRAWANSQESYLSGAIDYLTWLDTARTYNRYLDDLHIFKGKNYLEYVDLFMSLGGGVPYRSPLPGAGSRPQLTIDSLLTRSTPLRLTTGWPPNKGWGAEKYSGHRQDKQSGDDKNDHSWLVRLSGIHTREVTEATWRDLLNRFPNLVEGKALLALAPVATVKPDAEAASWYSLAVEVFLTENEARQWCTALRRSQTRCDVTATNKKEILSGRFPWPHAKNHPQSQLSIH